MLLPVLADTIARQRGKYYGFGPYLEEYPVFEQCKNIDQTPVNNLAEESQCGNAIPQPNYSPVPYLRQMETPGVNYPHFDQE